MERSFFDVEFGSGRRVAFPQENIHEPAQPADPDVDIADIRSQAIAILADEAGLTSEELAEKMGYLVQHPEFAAGIRADFDAAFARAKKLSTDELRAALEYEFGIMAEDSPDPAETERLQKEGILVPYFIVRQAVELEESEQAVKEVAGSKVGKIKTTRQGLRAGAWGAGGGVTVGATYMDYSFAKEGMPTLIQYAVEKLGAQPVMEIIGQKWSELLSMADLAEPAKNAVERAADGEGAAGRGGGGVLL